MLLGTYSICKSTDNNFFENTFGHAAKLPWMEKVLGRDQCQTAGESGLGSGALCIVSTSVMRNECLRGIVRYWSRDTVGTIKVEANIYPRVLRISTCGCRIPAYKSSESRRLHGERFIERHQCARLAPLSDTQIIESFTDTRIAKLTKPMWKKWNYHHLPFQRGFGR